LGSNLGNPKHNIEIAISKLKEYGLDIIKVAPFYCNPPLLDSGASSDLYKPFLNTAVMAKTELSPQDLLSAVKTIETQMLRTKTMNHEPRIIDIDILLYGDITVDEENLSIPHKEMLNRSFVLDPLSHLNANLKINGKSILHYARNNNMHLPAIMGILNITPDSFSEDGKLGKLDAVESTVASWVDDGCVAIIDIGAESTSPVATPISQQQELERLLPIFDIVHKYKDNINVRFSIDTYRYETAKIAIENGFKIINDVSGFKDARMFELVANNDIEAVIMHSFTIPASSDKMPTDNVDIVEDIIFWANSIINKCKMYNIDLSKIIIDPGIGFNKDAVQSLHLLQRIKEFQSLPCRILVGHSNKRFIKALSGVFAKDRLIETIGISLELRKLGVDIIRVHSPIEHKRVFCQILAL
jgi:dihydropteroate synthase/2-amino-4-hydroxy-6-hydroxymethyldihydropteridine diphosphokinase